MCMYSYAAFVWLIPSARRSAPVFSMDVLMEQDPGKLYFNCAVIQNTMVEIRTKIRLT